MVFIPPVSALDGKYDKDYYSTNSILFYNPEDKTCTQSSLSSSAGSLIGNTNAEKIWNWLKSQGLSSEQTAGVMGNIQQESGFSPTRHEYDKGWTIGGWGLAQWTSGRRTAIALSIGGQPDLSPYYDSKYGTAATDGSGRNPGVPVDINLKLLDFELNYLMQESQGRKVSKTVASQGYGTAGESEWDTLKKQTTVESATIFWHNNFEGSSDSAAAVIKVRGGFASSAYDSFSGSSIQASSTGSSSTATATACPIGVVGGVVNGSFSQLVKAYAWPDYKGSGFTQKTQAYDAAITKAKIEHRYVGNNGIDCGGFVTTLMVDSGFDPTYNSNGKGGDTTVQLKWISANWDNLGNGRSINTASLQPGDVAMLPGHTFVYVGHIDGFNSVIASASNGVRSPMAGQESLTGASVTWFRKKG